MNNRQKRREYVSFLKDGEMTELKKMIQIFQKKKNLEFEVAFKKINYIAFNRTKDHLANVIKESNISASDSLDISMILDDGNIYRVSLFDPDNIENFMQKFSDANYEKIKNYVSGLKESDVIKIIYKNRANSQKLYVEDFSILFRLTEELPIKGNSKPHFSGKILYRYKSRYSFQKKNVVIDITQVKESQDLLSLTNKFFKFEIEIEVTNDDIDLDDLLDEVGSILNLIQDTDFPIGREETLFVLQKYQNLLKIKSSKNLESRNVISIEPQHIIKFIPNKYAVTDKADGERYFLFLINGGTYLLSTNMNVKKLNIVVDNDECIDTLVDGELINGNPKIFLAFDVVYWKGTDFRFSDKYNLKYRLKVLNDIIDKCFGNLIPFNDYTVKNFDMDLTKIKKYYSEELKIYWNTFANKIKKSAKIFITRKLYFIPYGIDVSEIFMYADMIWKLYVYSKLTPYKLDGIIYTPINSPYMINTSPENFDQIPLEYKWKIPTQNSIDFYVKFEKDEDGNDIVFYDDAVIEQNAKSYKICKLYVGIFKEGQERPIPFKINGVEQKSNLYLIDGDTFDQEGNVINDESVVEFVYDTVKGLNDDEYKWIPLRIRYDKTESVIKYKRRYGNNVNIATRIWKTIINPITEDSISTLANPTTHLKEIERLQKDINSSNASTYYQKETSEATEMRAFNNWIKSNMILTYCSGKFNVLDIGCGRGGDLNKFIHAGITEYVGVDIDYNGLYVINNSALTRYKNLKKKIKNIPAMYFINADARAIFNVESQEKVVKMTNFTRNLIETFLSGKKTYNVINNQFTIHYYLSDELSWSNYCTNINNHLGKNGYLLITTFDGELIRELLMGRQNLMVDYTDNSGKKKVFFEIRKMYSDKEKNDLGLAIDLHNSLINNEGKFIREYLVMPQFLIESLKKKCGLELVETDSFYNLFKLYKNYFMDSETESFNLKQFDNIRKFYKSIYLGESQENDINAIRASFKLSMLNKYYVFRKTTNIDLEPARIVGINYKINLGKLLTPYFQNNSIIVDFDKKTRKINDIYRHIRKTNKSVNPSVYLIKHMITENIIDDDIYQKNKFVFLKVKEGIDNKFMLVYKSPEQYFFPIFHEKNNYDDFFDENFWKKDIKIQDPIGTYLLESKKIVSDIDILVALSKKFAIQ